MRFDDKVVVVTGGASGIGRAGAVVFAREGARVVVADIDAEGGAETVETIRSTIGESAYFQRCDVSDANDVQQLMDCTVTRCGGLDILFANAAHMGDFYPVGETSEESWDRSIGVTLKGTFLCAKYAIPHLIRRGNGSIIATASVGGFVAFDGMAAYCAAKGGVIMLVKSIARDYGASGIRANAIAPGRMRPRSGANPPPSATPHMSLLERPWAEPEEIAATAAFLASDDAAFITGEVIVVDGGWTAHWMRRNQAEAGA